MNEIEQLLERFRRGPELCAVVLTGTGVEEADFTPAPGKWSIRQIMAHLADAEVVVAHRMRLVIAEENPTLTAFDEGAWATRLDYARRKPAQSLETFRRMRGENFELLKGLPPETWERCGNHTTAGRLTLGAVLRIYVEHAENHARQMESVRAEYRKSKGKQ